MHEDKIYTKEEAYDKGLYRFNAPPVCTALWSRQNWITYIDAGRGWTVKVQEETTT